MGEASEDGGKWMLGGGQHSQHGGALAVGAQAPSSADDAFAVIQHDLEVAIPLSAEPQGGHLPHSAGKLASSCTCTTCHNQLEPAGCHRQGCMAMPFPGASLTARMRREGPVLG